MLDKVLKQVLGDRLSGVRSIKIELGTGDEQKEKEENEKQGMAPPLKEKDAELKGEGRPELPMLANEAGGEPEDDAELMGKLMSDDEEDDYLMMAQKGERPKGIMKKAEQQLAAKKFVKSQSKDKA